ncbi:MAG: hypothetical protein ABEJ62_02625 [Candidatus Nanohaloarchaea archaeon]
MHSTYSSRPEVSLGGEDPLEGMEYATVLRDGEEMDAGEVVETVYRPFLEGDETDLQEWGGGLDHRVHGRTERARKAMREYRSMMEEAPAVLEVGYRDGSSRTFEQLPRDDFDPSGELPPSAIVFQDTEEGVHPYDKVVLREMGDYQEKESSVIDETPFIRPNRYDDRFSAFLHNTSTRNPDTLEGITMVPESRDFLAFHGKDGIYSEISGMDGVPPVDSRDWRVLDVAPREDALTAIRPAYRSVAWDGTLDMEDLRMIGAWRGVNRGIGRALHDLEDEFYYVDDEGSGYVGVPDNDLVFAVPEEMDHIYDSAEWKLFRRVQKGLFEEAGRKPRKSLLEKAMRTVKEEERKVAERIREADISYWENIPDRLERGTVPEEMRVER